MNHPCPALLVAATASGQGKTTATAALARRHPQILEVASGAPVDNLDLWVCGADDGARRLHAAAQQADLILVEGVMGLYDGTPSSADIALAFDLPVLAVVDAGAMAQTFGGLALGLAHYRPGL